MHYTIYKITNTKNGKIYIGKHQTKNLDDGYFGSGKMLQRALVKHGKDNFTKEILFFFGTEEEMNAKEAELVTEDFCLREDTYNLCPGGKGGWSYINSSGVAKFHGKQHSDETKRLIGQSALGNTNFLGKSHTSETKKKIGTNTSLKLSGRSRSSETKNKISHAMRKRIDFGLIIEIIQYMNEKNISIRRTCKMFGLNRITFTKYYKEISG